MLTAAHASWAVAALATAGVIARPFHWPEAIWAVAGAVVLVASGLLPPDAALQAMGKGTDVYLFLTGMMLLSELGRREGLFEWAAITAVNNARGSPRRLFLLVYVVGTVTTVFLSNDATAVVLTPAVFMVANKARMRPLPLLFVCAFIANAASFVLPISNPANIVLYGDHMPALGPWLRSFALPSVAAIVSTYLLLRWTQRRDLDGVIARDLPRAPLSGSAWVALVALALTAIVLLVVSALGRPLGLPTAVLGALATLVVSIKHRESPWQVARHVAWGVLPLVGGLFVLVESLDRTGVTGWLARTLHDHAQGAATATAAVAAGILGFGANLMNNLPAGLVTSSAIAQAHAPQPVVDALLIAVDLGPNLSITGSLATILWLAVIRREGMHVSFTDFLKVGLVVMPASLGLALVALLLA